ncbi:MAG: OmpA family protein, partial [Pedobacter sp.]
MRVASRFQVLVVFLAIIICGPAYSQQQSFILNGDFEDVNTCSEYKSECGVEGWFYLSDVKAQMRSNEIPDSIYGDNSYALYMKWLGYEGFAPVIGTLLPCGLQKGNSYTFSGLISAELNTQLQLFPGIALGQKYYVPRRPFVKDITPVKISAITNIPKSYFFKFTYTFTATGEEKYLTFGVFVNVDTTGAKKAFIGNQTITMTLDHFQLVSSDPKETVCPVFETNKKRIYQFDQRHRDMDYPLYGKGEVAIKLDDQDSSYRTAQLPPPPIIYTDTLKLSDVFFDFNKANLKPAAINMLHEYFRQSTDKTPIDSIRIEGHTDSIGTEAANMLLSTNRCNAVRNWLLKELNLQESILYSLPFGESKPMASN